MEIISKDKDRYILRLAYGEELREALENFCAANNIKAAWFTAIGATKEIEIACYNLAEKRYDPKTFLEMMEITSIIGDISINEGRPFLHAHGTFARPQTMEVIGGHIIKCVISATCEISFWKIEGEMNRRHDEFTGLHLLCAESI